MQPRNEQRRCKTSGGLISAGYPRPAVVDEPGQLTLSWGVGVGVRQNMCEPFKAGHGVGCSDAGRCLRVGLVSSVGGRLVVSVYPVIAEPIAHSSESPSPGDRAFDRARSERVGGLARA